MGLATARHGAAGGVEGEPERHRSGHGNSESRGSTPAGHTPSPSVVRVRKSNILAGLKRLSRNHNNNAEHASTNSSSNGRYFALYDYLPQKEDELELVRGRDVEVLSKDKRECGDKNWWMGRSGGRIGIFPCSYVVEKTSLDRVNIFLPLEIDFEELTQKSFIGRGGFGKVYLCVWRGEEVMIMVIYGTRIRVIIIIFVHRDRSRNHMGAINIDDIQFLNELGRRITQVTDDNREKAFLYQRLSVLIQCYNAVVILGTFAHRTHD